MHELSSMNNKVPLELEGSSFEIELAQPWNLFPRPLLPLCLPDGGLRLLRLPRGAGDEGKDAGRNAPLLSRQR